MGKILVIDNNIDPHSHGCADILRCLEDANKNHSIKDFEPIVRRGPEQEYDFDHNLYSGVVISGSKTRIEESHDWVMAQMDFIKNLFSAKIPTFGLCYGEQLIVRALEGDEFVGRSKIGEFGLVEIEAVPDATASRLFKNLPKKYYSFCHHYDQVEKLSDDYVLLGSSQQCLIHAYEHKKAPMWGVQYHPEKNLEECKKSIDEIQESDSSVQISNDDATDSLYNPLVGDTLFSNFLEQVGIYLGQKR